VRAQETKKTIRSAFIGYGAAFNMGKYHHDLMNKAGTFELVAACDVDRARVQAAKQDFPGIRGFASPSSLLRWGEFDLAVIITPHNTHARLAVQFLNAGKHVVVEKPMCISAKEATDMIQAAKKADVMLSTFHNRRWDGDHLAMKDVIAKGLIGEPFRLEVGGGGYGHPGRWWRSDKRISGGCLYDWGAHLVDWVLQLTPGKVKSVTGFSQKRVWHDVTNEDEVQALILFESGAVADVQVSHIQRIGRPRWRILGEKGGILDPDGREAFRVVTDVQGIPAEMQVKYYPGQHEKFYQNISDHLLKGKPLAVTPESARRVIAVIEAAGKSAQLARAVPVPYE
jgi:predicted dehydrogenase